MHVHHVRLCLNSGLRLPKATVERIGGSIDVKQINLPVPTVSAAFLVGTHCNSSQQPMSWGGQVIQKHLALGDYSNSPSILYRTGMCLKNAEDIQIPYTLLCGLLLILHWNKYKYTVYIIYVNWHCIGLSKDRRIASSSRLCLHA